ncbi:MAG: hypothetical protein K6F79_04195 [Saccharofermentans sp.]|nr:hypothetical protein [Saccharofermentans sp.]
MFFDIREIKTGSSQSVTYDGRTSLDVTYQSSVTDICIKFNQTRSVSDRTVIEVSSKFQCFLNEFEFVKNHLIVCRKRNQIQRGCVENNDTESLSVKISYNIFKLIDKNRIKIIYGR